MKRFVNTAILVLMVLICSVGCQPSAKQDPNPQSSAMQSAPVDTGETVDADKALMHIHLQGRAVSQSYGKQVKAVAVDRTAYKPVSASAGVTFKGSPMLWVNAQDGTTVVDSRAFTDLKVVRAKMAKYLNADGQLVGRFLGGQAVSGRQLVKFLIQSDIIESNQHISAEVYLMSETTDEAGYKAELVSVDTYYTNQKNVDVYRFAVRINSKGEIRLNKSKARGMWATRQGRLGPDQP